MFKFPSFPLLGAILMLGVPAFASLDETENSLQNTLSLEEKTPFDAFTGKIMRTKVRLRQQPNLESPILREMTNGDMVIVLGEEDEFYAVQPPANTKGYVFRTFILDNVVEGSRVNIRSEPDLNAPIIAQLNTGDRVEGTICSTNNKWLEIALPNTARFYVAKDYVEKIGDVHMLARMEKRRDEVNKILNATYLASQTELQKPYPEVRLDSVTASYNKVVHEFSDFPDQVARAKELLRLLQDAYIQKKIAHLEAQYDAKDGQLKAHQILSSASKAAAQEDHLTMIYGADEPTVNSKMAEWKPVENVFYEAWVADHYGQSLEEYYQQQRDSSVTLTGIIEPYNRSIKNKPGDYMLISKATHLPIAYLYSTRVNLQQALGHEVTVHGVSRPNNNFAFPAYFVLSME